MYAGFLQEPKLLALAYDLEQVVQPRSQPGFVGQVPSYPDAGICNSLGAATAPGSLTAGRSSARNF